MNVGNKEGHDEYECCSQVFLPMGALDRGSICNPRWIVTLIALGALSQSIT